MKSHILAYSKHEKISIYYMRLLAIILIVNSHINPKHVVDFKSFAFYGYLGSLGNMIFFFISSYVLTLGFAKYKSQKLRWVLNREYYILSTIIILKVFFKYINGEEVNVLSMVINLFNDVNFISVMIFLSAIYPILFSLNRKSRNILFICFMFLIIVGTEIIDLKIRGLFMYSSIFLLGIITAQSKKDHRFIFNFSFFLLSTLIFISAKHSFFAGHNIVTSVTMFVKVPLIYFMFLLFNSFDFSKIPSSINTSIKEVAKLSLFIYVTHFYFINTAYQINEKLCLLVLILLLIPICYIESIIINPMLSFGTKLIMK